MKTSNEIKEDYYAGSAARQPSQLCEVCKRPWVTGSQFTCIEVTASGGKRAAFLTCLECNAQMTDAERTAVFLELTKEKPVLESLLPRIRTRTLLLQLREARERLDAQIADAQSKCCHDWKVTNQGNDHDGYSCVTITYYEDRTCNVCGKYEHVITGKSRD